MSLRPRFSGLICLALVLCFGSLAAQEAAAARRIALVVGNSGYQSLPPLANPGRDVAAVSRILREADFEVIEGRDLDRLALEKRVRTFFRSLSGADVALFYYSGHGIQVAGENYVVPIDAKLTDAYDLEFEALPLNQLMTYMKAGSKIQLVFLDACRNSPFEAKQFFIGEDVVPTGNTRGLARVNAGLGALVAYAAAEGAVALDGTGELSPFTDAFAARALTPAIEVRRMLDLVRRDVFDATDGQQVPWEDSSLLTDFYFVPPKAQPIVADLHEVHVVAGVGPQPLGIPEPRQPEGGALTVTLEKVPEAGTVIADGRALGAGDAVSGSELAGLTYDWKGAGSGAGLLVYRVDDAWGNSVRAMAAITATAAEAGSPSEPVAPPPDDGVRLAALAPLSNTEVAVDIGVGPRPVFADAGELAIGSDTWLTVDAVPELGVLRDGERPLRPGDSVAGARLAALTFEPQIGTEGRPYHLALGLGAGDAPAIGASITPRVHACDLFAGQPFDLQGVTAGRFANEIDAAAAIPGCLAAVATYPSVPRFFYELGRAELARGNADKARGLIEAAAARGHVRATFQLGLMERLGAQSRRDPARAASYFEQAAAQGDPYAMHSLAKLLFDGDGVDQDRKRALSLWLQAAEMGHTFAMNALGTLFLEGNGVKADPARALQYFEASAAREDIYGINNLGRYYLSAVTPNYDLALANFTRAYAGGHPFAPNSIGEMYLDGLGVPADSGKAAEWYERGARRGDPYAANNRAALALAGVEGLGGPSFAAEMYALAVTLDQGSVSEDAAVALDALPALEKRRAIQRMLTEAGYDSGPVDGIVGPLTRSAAVAFASAVGTTVDGVDDTRLILALARSRWLTEQPRFDLF